MSGGILQNALIFLGAAIVPMLVLAPVLGSEIPGSAGLMESDSKLWSAVKLREIFTAFALFLVAVGFFLRRHGD